MSDLPATNLPSLERESADKLVTFKSDSQRQSYILTMYKKWKHYQYDKWPVSLTLKPYDLDYFPNSPILAAYLTDDSKEHWIRFFVVNDKEYLIIDMFGDLRKFPAEWFPTSEVTPTEVEA